MTQRLKEIKQLLCKKIIIYSKMYNQAPHSCYVPISQYDELMYEFKQTAYEPTIEGQFLMEAYCNARDCNYITILECRLYRSPVNHIDFNVPDWSILSE